MQPASFTAIFLLACSCLPTLGDVTLASVFTSHMVLQREKPVPVWGTAAPGETVVVEFAGQKLNTVADPQGRWRVSFAPLKLNRDAQSLVVAGRNRIVLDDVLVGDVWLCSGQSNMQFPLKNASEGGSLVSGAAHPGMRLLEVPAKVSTRPQDRFSVDWQAATPRTAATFSAVGFLFGQRIHAESGVPIGLIECALGSTSAECWVSNETLDGPLFAPAIKKWREVEANWNDPQVREKHLHKSAKKPGKTMQPSEARTYPGGCFNAMLHPLFPFALKGVVWYQGEANRTRGHQYRSLLPAMIGEWRSGFGQDDLKFYVVQLPGIGAGDIASGGDSSIAELREAQWLTVKQDAHMGMAVLIDAAPDGELHPRNKQLPADRLARIALAKDYGQDIESSGPVFREMKTEGGKLRLFFDHLGGGLMVGKRPAPTSLKVEPMDEALAQFAVAGEDHVFHPAQAVIEGDTVVIGSEAVREPVAVRYAWADNPAGCNFYNKSGLPALPFRTDDWPCVSTGKVEGEVLVIR